MHLATGTPPGSFHVLATLPKVFWKSMRLRVNHWTFQSFVRRTWQVHTVTAYAHISLFPILYPSLFRIILILESSGNPVIKNTSSNGYPIHPQISGGPTSSVTRLLAGSWAWYSEEMGGPPHGPKGAPRPKAPTKTRFSNPKLRYGCCLLMYIPFFIQDVHCTSIS